MYLHVVGTHTMTVLTIPDAIRTSMVTCAQPMALQRTVEALLSFLGECVCNVALLHLAVRPSLQISADGWLSAVLDKLYGVKRQ